MISSGGMSIETMYPCLSEAQLIISSLNAMNIKYEVSKIMVACGRASQM